MRDAFRSLIAVWGALMALLAATVIGSFLLTGPSSIALSLGIALAKVALVFWFFMQLRRESGLVRVFAVGAAVWLMILLALTGTDYATRQYVAGF
jgi:cytochrome c oxidase subunit 4